jgi:hypothetical protein
VQRGARDDKVGFDGKLTGQLEITLRVRLRLRARCVAVEQMRSVVCLQVAG